MDRHGSPDIHALSDAELAERIEQAWVARRAAESAHAALRWERDWRAEQAARERSSRP